MDECKPLPLTLSDRANRPGGGGGDRSGSAGSASAAATSPGAALKHRSKSTVRQCASAAAYRTCVHHAKGKVPQRVDLLNRVNVFLRLTFLRQSASNHLAT